MNIVTIAGAIGRDIEMRYTPAGKAVGTFSVADSQGKDKPTIWWRCQIWDKRAESLAPYLLKGQSVTVSGVLTEREYQDKDGATKKAQEVRVNEIALMGGSKAEKPAAPAQKPAKAAPSGFDDDSDVPF